MHMGYVNRIRSASVTYGTDGKRMANNIGLYVGTVRLIPVSMQLDFSTV